MIGSICDGMGRTFTSSDTIKVLPVGALAFSMSDREYVGNKVPVVMDKLFNPDGGMIEWSVQKEGATYSMDLSTLNNDGGTLSLFDEGTYIITAIVRDDTGNLADGFANITTTNTAPVITSFTTNASRTM